MNKLTAILLLAASFTFAADLDGRSEGVPMFALPEKTVEITHEEKELDLVVPPVKRIEIKEVETMETPFLSVAWENNRTIKEESNEIFLGIGY